MRRSTWLPLASRMLGSAWRRRSATQVAFLEIGDAVGERRELRARPSPDTFFHRHSRSLAASAPWRAADQEILLALEDR